MDWVNRQTAHERPDLLEWRKHQGKAAWYGLWSIIVATGACSGWFVSHRIMRSFPPSDVDSAVSDINQSLGNKENYASPMQTSKFGDKDFIKE
ncbi:uncharacterized protein LOC111322159 isoform X2 [Stylophora pistillata]|uniref:uncharacterized protein LOC111322159 isoform X2 n=1 Tax=Stylophora pistillata TaxID=50429 RepID=UPI000C04B152|nr:uncharacterized protein LOC111322159 isoform X2 [Stylophora pistillata]